MNKQQFFTTIRQLFLSLNQKQVEGLEFILDYWQKQTDITDLRQFAYILGTIHHETGATMQPIEEWGKGKGQLYGSNVDVDKKPYFDTKNIFYGRGYTQNTWRTNYLKLTKANNQGWNFFLNPELLLQPEPSIWATFYAMRTGLYTGKKLSDYFNQTEDWVMARSIVNGKRKGELLPDKAEHIAELSRTYFKALTA